MGYNENKRYYPYYGMAFNLTKDMMLKKDYYDAYERRASPSTKQLSEIAKANSLAELHEAVNSNIFYVITECQRLSEPEQTIQGTRISSMTSSTEGYEFFIDSPVLPNRHDLFKQELDYNFQRFINALKTILSDTYKNLNDEEKKIHSDEAFKRALEFFFYWVNYAPLSRGTSATGYAALMAFVISMGEEILDPVPKGKQLDWEGLLTPQPDVFVSRISSWLATRGPSSIPTKWLDSAPGHKVREVFDTIRKMLAAIGYLE